MSETLDLGGFVQHRDGTAHMDLAVEGVVCGGRVHRIEEGLRQLPGVVAARRHFTNQRLAIDWHEDQIAAADLIATLERIGYRAHPFRPDSAETEEARYSRFLIKCLAVAGFAAMNIMLLSVSVWSGTTDMSQETRD